MSDRSPYKPSPAQHLLGVSGLSGWKSFSHVDLESCYEGFSSHALSATGCGCQCHVSQPASAIFGLVETSTIVMHTLRKLKTTVNTPAPAPASPAELVQNLTSRRDSKALAATSSAIALSISSAFRDPSSTSGDGPTHWRAACATIRMAVEITKESSDLCLPLKAVVGAIFVLIKNYDVSVSC